MKRDKATGSEFARRLHRALAERGWTQSELMRRAQPFLPEGVRLGRDSVSQWMNRPSTPDPVRLEAVAKALNMRPADLVPAHVLPAPAGDAPDFAIEADAGGETMYVRINQRLPAEIALEIQRLVLTGARQLREAR